MLIFIATASWPNLEIARIMNLKGVLGLNCGPLFILQALTIIKV